MADDAVLAENVSIALLRVLETLGPVERTVFVLDEVFETPFDEIAEVVGKTPAAVRQIASRSGCTKATHRDRDGGGLLGSRCRISQTWWRPPPGSTAWPTLGSRWVATSRQ